MKCHFVKKTQGGFGDEDSANPHGRSRKSKKPYRYRWPDEVRDEVLARLLKLNAERAEEERLVGLAAAKDSKTKRSNLSKAKGLGGPDRSFVIFYERPRYIRTSSREGS